MKYPVALMRPSWLENT